MTATDELLVTGYPNSLRPELHKALKARGIDYWVAQGITFWNRDDGCECLAYGYEVNGVPKLAVKVVGFTDSEQAIAATLGSGTCTLDGFADVPFSVDYEIEGYDMDSGRDYATLAECSACGAYIIVPPEYHHVLTYDGDEVYQPYRFCPNCGRRIE